MRKNNIFRRKSLTQILHDNEKGLLDGHEHGLVKSLGLWDLVAMGVAAVIGAGIFSTIGTAVSNGGPAAIWLFIITAVTCGFTAMCYAEFAARVPVSGSAYTYSYVTFGELVAWIIGWALILEYAIGNIVVAVSWSSYFVGLLESLGIHLPNWLTIGYGTAKRIYLEAVNAGKTPDELAKMIWSTAPSIAGLKLIVNLPACFITIFITWLAYIGIKESKRSANAMVVLKLVILALVIGVGVFYVQTSNWSPFMPNGFSGVMKGVSSVFFAYIGFDAISTTAEECKNPKRDLPRGMIISLIICTVIYVLTVLVITGMVKYNKFANVSDPLAFVFQELGLHKFGFIIALSAIIASTGVLLVFQIGQPRIWMSMSRDGLLPKRFATIHPRFRTPSFATIVTGFLVGVPVLFMDESLVLDLTSIGTLFAFVLVSGGVLALPKRSATEGSENDTKFKLPYINSAYIMPILLLIFLYGFQERIIESSKFWGIAASKKQLEGFLFILFTLIAITLTIISTFKKWSVIPILGVLCCTYLMIEIPAQGWIAFFVWMGIGLLVYLGYGKNNSHLAMRK